MKRALRRTLRGSSPSTRTRWPPQPLFPTCGSNTTAVGNQLSRLSSQPQRHGVGGAGGFTTSLDFQVVAPPPHAFARDSIASRGRGRGRGGAGGTRFGPRSGITSGAAVATAVGVGLAVAVAVGSGGKTADCEYPEGTRFGDVYYCSGKPLGSGSFGTVCTAQHRDTGKVVAVKRIPRTKSPALTFQEICWEVEVLKLAGEHRNITQFHDIFEDDDYYYLTMELARGGELFDQLVENGPPDEAHTAVLMKSLLEAVAFVHLHGIIHGDIKPENVFLTNSSTGDVDWGGVRLGDFGSAVEMALEGGTTMSGVQTRGTVAYNPPESLRRMLDGEDAVVTTMGDVWALGVVLFMLLTGEHPFTPDMSISDEEMAERVLDICDRGGGAGERLNEAALFSDADGGGARSMVSPLARDLILRMLTPDPERRTTPHEVLKHPWLKHAALGIEDPTMRTLDPRGYRHRHRRERYPRYGPPAPTNPEALRNFWSARRRLKAILLSLMCGLVPVEREQHTEEEYSQALTQVRLKVEKMIREEAAEAAGSPPPPPPPSPPPPPPPSPPPLPPGPRWPALAGIPAELLSGSILYPHSTRMFRPSSVEREERESAAAASTAAEREKAEKEAKKAAAAAAAAALFDEAMMEADGVREDRFTAVLMNPRFWMGPYANGSRGAACVLMDHGLKGYINRQDLERITRIMGERFTRAEISDMMRAIDGDPSTESRRATYGEMAEIVPPLSPPKRIKVGQTLYGEGQVDPAFYLLMKGSVEFSVSSTYGTTGLQRQLPGASFGEVELLRSDELSTPRLATCTCLGQPGGGDCEVLVVTEHMFDLLTDIFTGVRSRLDLQREIRLTQLAKAALSKLFPGEQASFGEEDVVWGQNGKETAGDWIKVQPRPGLAPPMWEQGPISTTPVPAVSRPSRLRPPRPLSPTPTSPSRRSDSYATSSSGEGSKGDGNRAEADVAEVAAAVGASGGGGVTASGGDVASPSSRGLVNVGARSRTSIGRFAASRGRGGGSGSKGKAAAGGVGGEGEGGKGEGGGERVWGADSTAAPPGTGSAAAAAATQKAAVAVGGGGGDAGAGADDNEGAFVLLVLEGSITAQYGKQERRGKDKGEGAQEVVVGGSSCQPARTTVRIEKQDQVFRKGDFVFCGEGFGDDEPISPKLVSCKPGQTAKVLRVSAKEFAPMMARRNMVSLKEYMFNK